jgi:hypothetical protein
VAGDGFNTTPTPFNPADAPKASVEVPVAPAATGRDTCTAAVEDPVMVVVTRFTWTAAKFTAPLLTVACNVIAPAALSDAK